ncbi:hypothetical protein B0H66DRAFT_169662 [Apodospora peruviana]|uniref:DUF7580 domain-containing protein n=1 Tax=Apodospora peruviana TaxID=516989 RepID=A0AAE0IKR7_9PEZI|nr:hypothetical protein B0H66DRAFT_169662 [Apodospora peruviana]
MDPATIATTTIKALELLWILGNETAELISNFKSFDNDAKLLEAKIRDESSNGKYMNHLLFDPSTAYNDKTLFEQFDQDVQTQIQIFFEQSTGVLNQAFQVLSRLFGDRGPPTLAASRSSSLLNSSSTTTSLSAPAFTYESKGTSSPDLGQEGRTDPVARRPSPLKRLWWSIHDKKRIEAIVREFSDLNSRILRTIQLWCLGAELGVDRASHLKRLESDPYSKALGFDIDARLQISTIEGSGTSDTSTEALQFDESKLTDGIRDVLGGRFGITRWQGRTALVEYRKYAPESPVPVVLDDRTKEIVDRLAKVLHQPKETIFRMPNCLGWTSQTQANRVAFLFAVPDGAKPSPISLLDILTSAPSTPPLGFRFMLALRLANCISQLQLVKWVHESFRSENILFFPRASESKGHSADEDETLDLTEPWVLGFENSRPDPFFSAGHPDTCPERDVYRHPSRQQTPTQHFNKIHDIYALGVVLLEIGLWQEALSLEKGRFAKIRDPLTIKKQLVKQAEKRLASKMGEKYKEVVLRCLEGRFEVANDTKEELKLQQSFRCNVVDVLERAAQYL